MQTNKYYGLGNDEYDIYQTFDNGKTWKRLRESPGDAVAVEHGRIIIYSDSGRGLKYSDDGLVTIMDSNIGDGSWKAIPMPPEAVDATNLVFALSLNERGIYVTKDNGEYWSKYSAGSGDTIAIDNNGIINIYGNGDVVQVTPEGPIYYPDATFTPEGPKAIVDEKPQGEGLIYILNEILIPKLSIMLTGEKDIKYFKINNEDMYGKYFTDGEVYKVDKEGIDWAGDVGMQPLTTKDIKELEEANEAAKKIMSGLLNNNEEELEKELLNNDSPLSKTFRIIDMAVNNRKNLVLKTVTKNSMKIPEDYEGISTPEGVSAMKMLYTVQKGALASIGGTIVNSIFTLDNAKKMAILRASIIETAEKLKGGIQSVLQAIKRNVELGIDTKTEISQNKDYIKMLEFNTLSLDWLDALNKVILLYYNECDRNIRNISSDEDRKYIAIAANKYREVRENMLDTAVDCVKKIEIQFPITGKNELDRLEGSLKFAIDQVTAAATKYDALPDEGKEEGKKVLKDELDTILTEYKAKELEISDDPDGKLYISRIKEMLLTSLQEDLNDRINFTEKNDIDMYNRFFFDEVDYQEDLARLSPEEVNKVFKYYRQIVRKFKERCCDLMGIVALNQEDLLDSHIKLSGSLSGYINGLKTMIDKSTYKGYENYQKNYSISYMADSFNNLYDDYLNVTKRTWINMREKI